MMSQKKKHLYLLYRIFYGFDIDYPSCRLRKGRRLTYLMKDTNTGCTKIGKSADPRFRESTLQSEKPTIELYKVCAFNVEKELHNKYKDKRVRGEWFRLSENEISEIVDNYAFVDWRRFQDFEQMQ